MDRRQFLIGGVAAAVATQLPVVKAAPVLEGATFLVDVGMDSEIRWVAIGDIAPLSYAMFYDDSGRCCVSVEGTFTMKSGDTLTVETRTGKLVL